MLDTPRRALSYFDTSYLGDILLIPSRRAIELASIDTPLVAVRYSGR